MVEIVFQRENKGGNGDKNHIAGDPHIAMPDGFAWGSEEDKRFYIVKHGNSIGWHNRYFTLKISGISLNRARIFIEPHKVPATILDTELSAPDPEDRFVYRSRKRWGLFIDELPERVKTAIDNNGYAEVTVDQIKPFFRHKTEGIQISG